MNEHGVKNRDILYFANRIKWVSCLKLFPYVNEFSIFEFYISNSTYL